MTSTPKDPTSAELAGMVREVRQASAQQRREVMSQSPSTTEGSALQNVLAVLEKLAEWLPCLDEQQRVTLATGQALGVQSLAEQEIQERLFAFWWKSGDRDALDLRIQVLLADGVLRPSARSLIKRVRNRVDERLTREQLQSFEVLEWSESEVRRRSEGEPAETEISKEASELANRLLEAYSAELKDGDSLVYGQITPEDAHLWIQCSKQVSKVGMKNMSTRMSYREQALRKTKKLFNKVRQSGCDSLPQYQQRLGERKGSWGKATQFRMDSRGQMVNGLNQPVRWDEAAKRYEVEELGFMSVFGDRQLADVVEEINRAARASR